MQNIIEIWKDIENYEGLYQVSNLGRVKSLGNDKKRREKILKPVKKSNCYLQVILYKEGKIKTLTVHRLVAAAFIPNPENLPEVNHKDEDKTNNCVENLEWCDSRYNCNYGKRNERISKRVLCIETGIVYQSIMEVERQLGFANTHISDCCLGKRRTCCGYTWRYVE